MLINERGFFVYLMISAYWLGLRAEFLEPLVGFEGKPTGVLCYEKRVLSMRTYKHR